MVKPQWYKSTNWAMHLGFNKLSCYLLPPTMVPPLQDYKNMQLFSHGCINISQIQSLLYKNTYFHFINGLPWLGFVLGSWSPKAAMLQTELTLQDKLRWLGVPKWIFDDWNLDSNKFGWQNLYDSNLDSNKLGWQNLYDSK